MRVGPTPLLALRDLRRHPALVAAVALLALMVGFLGNISVLLLEQYPQQTGLAAKRWSSPQAVAVFPSQQSPAGLEQAVEAEQGVTQAEVSRVLVDKVSFPFAGRTNSVLAVVRDFDNPGELGERTITSQAPQAVQRPVWLPELLHAVGGYELGQAVQVTTSAGPQVFHVQGFYEDSYFGVPGLGVIGIGLSGPDFEAAWQAASTPGASGAGSFPGASRALMVEADAGGAEASDSLLERVSSAHTDHASPLARFAWTMNLGTLAEVTRVPSGIFGAILVVTALLITLVAVLVIRAMLRSVVSRDLPVLGTLRACGFTSSQAARSLTWCFTTVALAAALAGVALSYAGMPVLTSLLTAQSGLTWVPSFSWLGLVLSALAATLVVLAVSALTVRRLRRVSPVEMLSGGQGAHTFKRAPLPLATTPGPLGLVLGAGQALQSLRRSVMVAMTIMIATTVTVSILGLSSALLGDEDRTLQIISGEIEDLDVFLAPGTDLAATERELEEMDAVESAYPLVTVFGEDVAVVGVDSSAEFRSQPVREGRYPRSADEVVLGAGLARSLGLGVGDTWTISNQGSQASFLVTGLATGGRNLGRFVYVTTAGAQRVSPETAPTFLAVNLSHPGREGETGRVAGLIQAGLGDKVEIVHDQREAILLALEGYLATIPVLVSLLSGFSAVIVVLVVSLVVGSVLREERRSLGVRKTLGFTHAQLASQLLWTVLPPLLVGAVLGSLLGSLSLGALVNALLLAVGSLGLTVQVPALLWAGVPAAVVVTGVLTLLLLSLRIRKVSPHDLVAQA